MITSTGAKQIRRRVDKAAPGTFFRASQFRNCARYTADTTLSKLARERSDFRRIWRGLYWKGVSSRFGSGSPNVLAAAITYAGRGSGPSGISAANALGLSTQVASHPVVALVGRAPTCSGDVRFSSRSNTERLALRPLEIALLEVLRDFPRSVEVTWDELVQRSGALARDGKIRVRRVARAARVDRSRAARNHMHRLQEALTPGLAASIA